MRTIKLYRPVGLKELELIMQSGWKHFLVKGSSRLLMMSWQKS